MIKNNINVDCLPGSTAFVPALVISGIGCERFVFEGFLPVKKGRLRRLELLAQEKRTIILYESPHRVIKTLTQLIEYFGSQRQASVSREISKVFQETKRGTIDQILRYFNKKTPKGEFVIILEGKK